MGLQGAELQDVGLRICGIQDCATYVCGIVIFIVFHYIEGSERGGLAFVFH